jgi:hypothetical protein
VNPPGAGVARVRIAKQLELAGLPPGRYPLDVTTKDLNTQGVFESTFAGVQQADQEREDFSGAGAG